MTTAAPFRVTTVYQFGEPIRSLSPFDRTAIDFAIARAADDYASMAFLVERVRDDLRCIGGAFCVPDHAIRALIESSPLCLLPADLAAKGFSFRTA